MSTTNMLKVFTTSLLLFTLLTPSSSAPFSLFPSSWRSSLPSTNLQWKRAGIFSNPHPLSQMRNGLEGITSNYGRGVKRSGFLSKTNPLAQMMHSLEGITSNLGRGIKRAGIFSDTNPLSRLSTGLEGITASLGKGVKSLLDAGSILGQRVLGLSAGLVNTRPSLPPLPNYGFSQPRPPPVYEVDNTQSAYDAGPNNEVNQFVPVESSINLVDESYGSPIGNVQESYESPTSTLQESYESPTVSVQESHSSPLPSFQEVYKPTNQEANDEESYGSPLGPVVVDLASTSQPLVTYNWDPIPHSSPIITIPQISPTISISTSISLQQELVTPTISNIDQSPSISPLQEVDTPITSNLEHAVILGAASVIQGASAPVPDQDNPSKYEQHDPEVVRSRLINTLYYKDLGPLKEHLANKRGHDGKVRPHLKLIF